MSTTALLIEPNTLVSERDQALEILADPRALLILHLLGRANRVSASDVSQVFGFPEYQVTEILEALAACGILAREHNEYRLSEAAARRVAYGHLSLQFLAKTTIKPLPKTPHSLHFDYEIGEIIGRGATSFTFFAKQSDTHRYCALKVFLPNTTTYSQLQEALSKRSDLMAGHETLPEILDVGNLVVKIEGREIILPCVAFKYISQAITFAEFLKRTPQLNPVVFEQFITRVGGALARIESIGLRHGDLHENNILVVPGDDSSTVKEFWVIDFIGVPSSGSPHILIRSDLENFRDHLLNAAIVACRSYPGLSARLALGDRAYRVLQGLRTGAYKNFKEMLASFNSKSKIPVDHFRTPQLEDPFKGLRVEAISDRALLYKLFVPVPSRFETIARFGNTWISGPRGCGKSHYLRVLEFNPEVIAQARNDNELQNQLDKLGSNYRTAFGILFPCRLGEFRSFDPKALGDNIFDYETKQFLKHILVLKIWNKTLSAMRRGGATLYPDSTESVLRPPSQIHKLWKFLEGKLGQLALIGNPDAHGVLSQCLGACSAIESSAVAVWNKPSLRPRGKTLNEQDLDEFFVMIREVFEDLSNTQFYVLVDDVSVGAIHLEMQKILNSLVRSAQSNHCFKITFDKYAYTPETAEERTTDPRHEVTYVDLGEISTKAQKPNKATQEMTVNLSDYMEQVVNLRLKAAGYQHSIRNVLGESQPAAEFLIALSQPGARRGKTKSTVSRVRRAYYAGWNIVLSLSHGSVRTLLELVEHIYRTARAIPSTSNINLARQDAAVKKYSERQFNVISMFPEEIDKKALGPRLQSVISAFGRISREYLQHYQTGEESRRYETITIERLDAAPLNETAELIMNHLVRNGLVLDEGVTFSRAQIGLIKRYDLNKIFAPAFQTTYRVRNHLYLSKERLEELLVNPSDFLARHRKKLERLVREPDQHDLFV